MMEYCKDYNGDKGGFNYAKFLTDFLEELKDALESISTQKQDDLHTQRKFPKSVTVKILAIVSSQAK